MPDRDDQTYPVLRLVTPEDVTIVRTLILQMLEDSPLAFGDRLADAQVRSETDWSGFLEHLTELPDRYALLVIDEIGACGFVGGDGANPQTPPSTVLVSRLWVNPRRRGNGLGQELMDSITRWAAERGADKMAPGVTDMNTVAFQFYEHLCYTSLGVRVPWPPDPTRQIIILV